jgi:hypothetical protein
MNKEQLVHHLQRLELRRVQDVLGSHTNEYNTITAGKLRKMALEATVLRYLWIDLEYDEGCAVSSMPEAWQRVREYVEESKA